MSAILSPGSLPTNHISFLEEDVIELIDTDAQQTKKHIHTITTLYASLAPLLEELYRGEGETWFSCANLVHKIYMKDWQKVGKIPQPAFVSNQKIRAFAQELITIDQHFDIDSTSIRFIFSFLVKQLEPFFIEFTDTAFLLKDRFGRVGTLIRNYLKIHPFFDAKHLAQTLFPKVSLIFEGSDVNLLTHFITLTQSHFRYSYPNTDLSLESCWLIKLIVHSHLAKEGLTATALKKEISAICISSGDYSEMDLAEHFPFLFDEKSEMAFCSQGSAFEIFVKKQLQAVLWTQKFSEEVIKGELKKLTEMVQSFKKLSDIEKEALISFWSYSGDMVFANNDSLHSSVLYTRCVKIIQAYKECHPLIGHRHCISNLAEDMLKIDLLGFHIPEDLRERTRLAEIIYKTWWFSASGRGILVEACDLAIDYLALQIVVDEDSWEISPPGLLQMLRDKFEEMYPIYPFNEARANRAVFDLLHKKKKIRSGSKAAFD